MAPAPASTIGASPAEARELAGLSVSIGVAPGAAASLSASASASLRAGPSVDSGLTSLATVARTNRHASASIGAVRFSAAGCASPLASRSKVSARATAPSSGSVSGLTVAPGLASMGVAPAAFVAVALTAVGVLCGLSSTVSAGAAVSLKPKGSRKGRQCRFLPPSFPRMRSAAGPKTLGAGRRCRQRSCMSSRKRGANRGWRNSGWR